MENIFRIQAKIPLHFCSPESYNFLYDKKMIDEELKKAAQFHHSGQLDQAGEIYKKILEIHPNHAEALHMLGLIAHQQGRNDAAADLIGKSIQLSPGNPNSHNNLGVTLKAQGKQKEAIACYQNALQIQPDYAEAYNNIGNVLRELGKSDKAVACYQKAIQLKPDFAGVSKNLAVAFKDQGKLDEAVACYQKALQLQPDNIGLYKSMGNALRDQGQTDEAVSCYEKALGISPDPGIEVIKALAIPAINTSGEQIEQTRTNVIRELESLRKKGIRLDDPVYQVGISNFYFAYHALNDKEIQQKIAEFYLHVCPGIEEKSKPPITSKRQQTIRIGFVSLHLCHPTQQTVGKLTRGIVRNLSREKFHVTLFCFSGKDNRMTKTFDADEVVVLPNHLTSAREKIAARGPDILFYPDIGMDALTYFLGFSRLAPVQCVTWGHPVTTGIPNMDYFISSEMLEPDDAQAHYSEKLVLLKRLPVYYDRPRLPEKRYSREAFGLSEDHHLYVCPQALFKFHPDFDAALAAILRSDPRAQLVFLEGSYKHFTTLIWQRFQRAFSDVADRVRFLSFMPHDAFLSLLMLADVLIDPPYFGGGNTTYESFALGCPIVTWPGPFMRGRVTLGAYKQMDVTDCVAHDAPSYVNIALRLANDKAWRENIRNRIRANAHRLFEDTEVIRELEKFFERAVRHSADTHQERILSHKSPFEGGAGDVPKFEVEAELRKVMAFYQEGRAQDAEAICRKILEIDPNHAEALHVSGVISHQSGDKELAVSLIRRAIRNNPSKACYHNSLGITFQDQGRTNEAIVCYQKALEVNPGFAEAYCNIGFALLDQGRAGEAIACYQKALEIKPGDPVAYNDMGTAFQEQGRVDEAVSCYHKALEIMPNYPQAYNNLGNAFKEQTKVDESIQCYKKALEINPGHTKAYCYLIRQLQQTCAWDELDNFLPKLDKLTRQELESGAKTSESPFMNLARSTDLAYNLAVAKSWADDAAKPMRNLSLSFPFEHRRTGRKKITLGYLSGDFRNHAVSHLMLGLFGLHDRKEFEVCCYSHGVDDGSDYRRRIARDSDKFVDIRTFSHADAAKRIYGDGVDILVELTGHTKDCRLGICALRPSPIQAIYLGFPGTSGADYIDYIITDKTVTPEDQSPFYTEKFVCMPHCFQVNDNTQAIAEKNWEKSDLGLPEESFIFCSFNHGYKIEPLMFDVWMRILRKVPKGVLWLPKKSETGVKNLRREAEKRGVSPERLIFADRLPTKAEYLARISLADLALDTRIYNGHTTTSDALWAGVPVITLLGRHYASRVASSVLGAVGLAELITHDPEAYERLAVHLANSPEALKAIRMKLANNRLTAPLFDTQKFVRNLENAYKKMWEIFLTGEKARQV